jgi:hypothetical protein
MYSRQAVYTALLANPYIKLGFGMSAVERAEFLERRLEKESLTHGVHKRRTVSYPRLSLTRAQVQTMSP